MLAYMHVSCGVCGNGMYGIVQDFKRCTKCRKFICDLCQKKGCTCGNKKYEDEFERVAREYPDCKFCF